MGAKKEPFENKNSERKAKRKKQAKRILWLSSAFMLLLVFALVIVIRTLYNKQDEFIQAELDLLNQQQHGKLSIGDTHLEPFEHFPFISIKVDSVKVYESKEDTAEILLDVADIYLDFDIWDIVDGNFNIKKLLIEDGYFNFIMHKDGTNSLANALAAESDTSESAPLDLHLEKIELKNLDLHKLVEESHTDIETFIYHAEGGFKSEGEVIAAHVDSKFEMNVVIDKDTTYIKHKHFELHTDLTFDKESGILTLKPSGLTMEHGDFNVEGTYETQGDMNVDMKINGTKPNFDMFIAFAPEDIIPVLERYRNAGKIYFNAHAKGPTSQSRLPEITADFGASEAFLENTEKAKIVDEMGFQGHFSTGTKKDLSEAEFSLKNMTAKLEKGNFVGAIVAKNFLEPDILMDLHADFDIGFLAEFFNVTEVKNTSGTVKMDLKFHDVIDLDHPEKALSDINKAYFLNLLVKDLSFESKDLPAPLEKLNLDITMRGKEADIDVFDIKLGGSDVFVKGYLSDLPAIVHHTDDKVKAHLDISAKSIDIAELTKYSKKDSTGVDEQITDFSVGFSFESSARAFTESKYLPEGEFFIDSLHAQLKHYPHELHDFHADILVGERDLKIKDFTGYIDKSDFHFNGLIHEYEFWMMDTLQGDVDLDITLKCDMMQLEDVFSYQGENYVPEEYRHEELDKLVLHVNSSMHYKDHALHSIDVDLDKFDAKMHLHPMRFEDFKGRFHYEDDHLMIQQFHAKMGRSVFNVDMNYYLGEDQSIKKRDNFLTFKANYIDFDQLMSFSLDKPGAAKPTAEVKKDTADVAEHAEAFNLYELPFTDMKFDVDIGHFIYHRIDLQEIHTRLRTTQNHYLHVDTLALKAAGGSMQMTGYFNGSDPKHIYLRPKIHVQGMEIDQLLFKFENFGQDALVSDNVHGQLFCDINGKIRMYPDMIPDLDQSEIHMDVKLLNGSLVNYEPMNMLSDYMGDKDLSNIRFDTLQNHMDITNGVMNIPEMTLETTVGHYEMSGTQDMDLNMEYYLRIPWKTIRKGAAYRLFGKKKGEDTKAEEDKIIEKDPNKKTRYLNLKIVGDAEDFSIKLGKKKKKKKRKKEKRS